jgi:hypothetical protein
MGLGSRPSLSTFLWLAVFYEKRSVCPLQRGSYHG